MAALLAALPGVAVAGPAMRPPAEALVAGIESTSASPADSSRLAVPGVSTAPDSAAVSAPGGTLLDRLKAEDDAFFGEELLSVDRALRDSLVARYDSLGYEAFAEERRRAARRFELGFRPATRLLAYNRVEGLVAGLGTTVAPRGPAGPRLALEAAWATAPGEARHHTALAVPLHGGGRPFVLRLEGGDAVVPYGANRPTANGLRALLGAADDQDYLRRRGGSATLVWSPSGEGELSAAWDAARETSVRGREDFSVLGHIEPPNAPIEEGIDRAVTIAARRGSLATGPWELALAHRVAGGELGGDFDYVRTDVTIGGRRYLAGAHEVALSIRAARAGGDAPVQRLADAGGIESVRGFDRRARVGKAAGAARLEYFAPWNVPGWTGIAALRDLRLQVVPWADAARVWEGNADAWIASVGLGLSYYLGPFGKAAHLRLDAAFPTGPDRPDDVRFVLRFAAGLF